MKKLQTKLDILRIAASKEIPYNQENKKQFHLKAKLFLRELATHLGLDKSDYDLRSNMGGIAVHGEITLHSDSLYCQISGDLFGRNKESFLIRSCKNRSDYSGGHNHHLNGDSLSVIVELCDSIINS